MNVLEGAEIDTKLFQAHSVRAASTSKAKTCGLSVGDILSRGNWSNKSTWQRFYHKEIMSSAQNFQLILLNK